MWPFKKKEPIQAPKLMFTERQTSPYNDDNVTIIYVDNVVHGTIVKTRYGTWKMEFCGANSEYTDIRAAIEYANKQWDRLHTLRRIGIK